VFAVAPLLNKRGQKYKTSWKEYNRWSITSFEGKEESARNERQPSEVAPAPLDKRAGTSPVTGRAGNGGVVRYHSPGWVELPVVEPWPEAVDGKELLDGLMRELGAFRSVFEVGGGNVSRFVDFAHVCLRLRDVTTLHGD